MKRTDGRKANELRPIEIIPDFIVYPEGSVLISFGRTKIICNASVQDGVPPWMKNESRGWVTGEYSLLPRSTHTRTRRETNGPSGRSQEIQRLIGRSLRAAVDLEKLGPRTITLDCDVIQADGGTRTAAITGAYVALEIALKKLIAKGQISKTALRTQVAAVSVGIIKGAPLIDLCYDEDAAADVDANVVMTGDGQLIEFQATAEGASFSKAELRQMLDLADRGIDQLLGLQRKSLKESSNRLKKR